jgi:hypothetical protein
MKRKLFLNEICDSLDRERDHLLHLQRLYTIKPTLEIKSPIKPRFLIQNNSRLLKRAQTQYNIDYENEILKNRLSYINTKNGPYNQNYLRPKSGLPAFRKTYINYSFQEVENMKKTFQENIKFYNKVNNMKSYYDYQTINKEAKNQVKYMNYLLRQNKYIKKPPTLNYIDIDQYRRLVEQQNEEGDNEIIEEDIKEEEKENEDKLNKGEEINGNNNINQNENEENLNKNRNDKKINISTTNNSTKEKNIEHNS